MRVRPLGRGGRMGRMGITAGRVGIARGIGRMECMGIMAERVGTVPTIGRMESMGIRGRRLSIRRMRMRRRMRVGRMLNRVGWRNEKSPLTKVGGDFVLVKVSGCVSNGRGGGAGDSVDGGGCGGGICEECRSDSN